MGSVQYRNTQTGTFILSLLGGLGLLMLALLGVIGPHVLLLLPLLMTLVAGVLFASLTTEIVDGELRIHFGPGLIRRRIALAEIRSASAVKNRWWYGWGIRYTPHGWLFNVSGLDAVELVLANGKRLRVGTDRPEELARAVNRNIDTPTP